MPDVTATARPAGQREQQGQSILQKIIQAVVIWLLMQFVMKQFTGSSKQSVQKTDADGKVVSVPANTGSIPAYQLRPHQLDEGAEFSRVPQALAPIWPDDSKVDIIVSVSSSHVPTPLKETEPDRVVLDEKGFGLGNFSDKRMVDATITVPKAAQQNGTLWGHFYVGLSGAVLDPTEPAFDPGSAYHFVFPMTQHVPNKKESKKRSLLGSNNATEKEKDKRDEESRPSGPVIANHYHPNHTLSFVPGSGVLRYNSIHPAVRHFLHLESTGARDGSGQNTWYYPILFVNTFWQLKSHMMQLNETVREVPIHIDLNNLAYWKFMAMATVEMGSKEAARQSAFGNPVPGGSDGSEVEMIKEILLATNPILLGITFAVSIAHMILEMLAFGSDIAHYRKKKDNVGISVRSILANVFMQTVIFLYLVDQSQNTSWMIIGSQGIGILIEFWKITTVVNVRLRPTPAGSLIPYRILFEDKHNLSETEKKTKEYDEIAFKYMYALGVPLLMAYASYSLMYEKHKSWYSYVVATLVGSVYAYGFLMMVPSLYINYRLKSVAHMPGKAMMYKFLNTFIDDLFAFTIKMPFLHRLACFRDDIIFFIYMYQRWAYKVDYMRVNEFGQGGEADEASEKKIDGEPAAGKESTSGSDTAQATGAEARSASKRR